MEGQPQPQPQIPQQPVQQVQQPQPVMPPPSNPVPVKRKFSINKKLVFVFLGILGFLVVASLFVKVVATINKSRETKLTWWVLEEDKEALDPIIAQYSRQNPKVKIEVVKESSQDYRERLSSSLSHGTGPDIFEYHNSWVPMFINNLEPVKQDFSSIFYPVVTSDLRTFNGFVGVPLEYDGIGLFLNQDIFATYGKNFPKTWDDLRSVAQQLTVRDSSGNIKQSGVSLGVTSNIDYWQDLVSVLMLQNGAELNKPASLRGQSALTFYTNFSKNDRVWDDTLPNAQTYFAAGKLAMYFGTYRDVFNIRQQNPSLRFTVTPLPQLPGTTPVTSLSYANYWVNGVSNKSDNKDVAWDFLKFMMSQDTLRELNKNEKSFRGYGNLYPRVDMQNELLADPFAGPFVYQGNFARSWYLVSHTFDGATGINSQVAKPYKDAIDNVNLNTTPDKALQDLQTSLTGILGSYGIR